MGLLRGIGRAAPLLAAGLAAGWYLRRQGLLGGAARSQLPAGSGQWAEEEAEQEAPEPSAQGPEPGAQGPEPEMEAHVQAVEAVSDAADVTSVVEDLLAVAPGEQQEIVDAEVVTEADLVETVRAALAESPGLLSGSMRVEADAGVVWLRGELERPDAIIEAERRAASVPGVAEVRNLLHLPGTPPPRG